MEQQEGVLLMIILLGMMNLQEWIILLALQGEVIKIVQQQIHFHVRLPLLREQVGEIHQIEVVDILPHQEVVQDDN